MSIRFKHWILGGLAGTALMGSAAIAEEQALYRFDLPAQPLAEALRAIARQTGANVLFESKDLNGIHSKELKGQLTTAEAIRKVLEGTRLEAQRTTPTTVIVQPATPNDSAQTAISGPQTTLQLEEILVTGSHLRGGSSAYPVTFIDRERLDRSTATSVSDVLQQLPQNFSAFGVQGGASQFNGGNNNYYAAVAPDLRGLGPQATLTLINGLRLPATSLTGGQFVDVSLIPLAAVERIEVLSDTASGAYGSDAIAGAVNFVLRRDYQGAETAAKYSEATRGGYGEKTVSQLFGGSWGSGSATVALEWQENSALTAGERRLRPANVPGSARDAETIIPWIRHYSGLVSFEQSLPADTQLSGWVLASQRDTRPVFGSTILRIDEVRSDVLMGALTLQRSFASDWQMHASLGGMRSTLDDVAVVGSTQKRNTEDDSFNAGAGVEGSFGVLGRQVRTALGLETLDLRHDEPTTVPVVGDRTIDSAFAEIGVPLLRPEALGPGIRQLDLSASVRHDRYSDFGSTTNEKYGIAWSPVDGLKVRASYGTAFRAPSLYDVYGPQEALHISFTDPESPTGESNQLWFSTANPDVRPETARGYTFGIDVELPEHLGTSLSLTYYRYDYRERINSPGFAGLYLSNPTIYAPYIVRDPSAAQVQAVLAAAGANFTDLNPPFDPDAIAAILDQRNQNLSRQVMDGIDLALDFARRLESSQWDARLDVAYILKSDLTFIRGTAPTTVVDVFQRPVDLRIRGTLGWARGNWRVMTGVNYVDSYRDNTSTIVKTIEDWTTVDLKGTYAVPEGSSILSGISLSLAIRNVFDADPPTLPGSSSTYAQFGYDPTNADVLGRLVTLELSKRW